MAVLRRRAFGSEVAASDFTFQSTDGAKRRVRARVGKLGVASQNIAGHVRNDLEEGPHDPALNPMGVRPAG
jgi:hypothetical protein